MFDKYHAYLIGAGVSGVKSRKDKTTIKDDELDMQTSKEKEDAEDIIKIEGNLTVGNTDEKYLPNKITDTVDSLSVLSKKVDAAEKAAAEATRKAEIAKKQKTGFWHNSTAIESIQEALPELTKAQDALVEAQKVSFEFQEQLAEATKYLFGLGVANIAMNRTVVRELQLKLEGASKEELNDLARQELMGVISQLKAQEDMMSKTEKNTSIIKEHHKDIGDIKEDVDDIEKNIDDVEENIDDIEETIDEIEEDIDDIEKNIDEVEEDIDDIEKNIDEVEEDIDDIEKNIDEVEENIDDIEKNIDEVEEDVEDNKNRIDELFAEIELLKKNDTEISKKLLEARIIAIVSVGTSAAGLILSVLVALGIV